MSFRNSSKKQNVVVLLCEYFPSSDTVPQLPCLFTSFFKGHK